MRLNCETALVGAQAKGLLHKATYMWGGPPGPQPTSSSASLMLSIPQEPGEGARVFSKLSGIGTSRLLFFRGLVRP